MKINGYDIEIIRGETASVTFTLTDTEGLPFRLLTSDAFALLYARFRVKANPYSKLLPEYVIDKQLDLSTIKRFSDIAILNIKEYSAQDYNPLMWNDNFSPAAEDLNRLFYHPDLRDYRYYDSTAEQWVPYTPEITIPFEIADTSGLDYKEYFYDLTVEAGNTSDVVEYINILVNQHRFVVSYKV